MTVRLLSIERPVKLDDVPAGLRYLASLLESDISNKAAILAPQEVICRVSVVVRLSGESPRVYAYGQDAMPSQTFMDLHAGAEELMAMVHPARD